jgi:hypothetical protein
MYADTPSMDVIVSRADAVILDTIGMDGPSSSAIRCRSQATASCCRQKRRW